MGGAGAGSLIKDYDYLRNIDWNGDRDGVVYWDGYNWKN